MKLLVLSLLICFGMAVASCQKHKEDFIYSVGFKVLKMVDSSRLYKPDSAGNHYLHYRPIDVDVWYPADSSATDSILAFGQLLELFEQRANYYTDSKAGEGLPTQFAKSFSDFFHCSSDEKILAFPTRSRRNASLSNGKFPLVVYMASYNGMGYENSALLEALTSNGFAVASISSIGRYPGDMTMQQADLMEQVKDASFSLDILKKHPEIDSTRMVVIGYSWGGLASAVLAMKRTDIDAMVSLDGSEFHHYGIEKEEDSLFNLIRNDLRALPIPYLRLESSLPADTTAKKDSVYNFSVMLKGPQQIYKIHHTTHQDFSYLPTVTKLSGGCPADKPYGVITKLVVGYCNQVLQQTSAEAFADSIRKEEGKTIQPIL